MNKLRELTKGMNKWLGMQALHICDNSQVGETWTNTVVVWNL